MSKSIWNSEFYTFFRIIFIHRLIHIHTHILTQNRPLFKDDNSSLSQSRALNSTSSANGGMAAWLTRSDFFHTPHCQNILPLSNPLCMRIVNAQIFHFLLSSVSCLPFLSGSI